MFLAIDQGNTSVKATFIPLSGKGRGGEDCLEVTETLTVSPADEDRLLTLMEQRGVQAVAFGSVGRLDVRLVETLRNAVGGRLMLLTHHTPLPIGVEYDGRDTLGLDRVAAAAGAVARFPGESILVVDAGTAMTLDVVDAGGSFRGGNIAPGLQMRFGGLHQATASLPLVEGEGEVPFFGHDTLTAIRSGVVGGMCAEIVMAFIAARRKFGCDRILLTGGDAPLLFRTLPSFCGEILPEGSPKLSLQPNLVAGGLLHIFNYNETYL